MRISEILQAELLKLVTGVDDVLHIHSLPHLHLGNGNTLRHEIQRLKILAATIW